MDDWKIAINRNRRLLGVIVGELVALAQREDTLRRSVLRILRPAESALRRLIVVVAAMLAQKLREATGERDEGELPDFSSFATYDTLPAFQLIDPRQSFDGTMRPIASGIPRIAVPGVFDPVPLKKPNDTLDAVKLMRRIRKLKIALANLPRQARRLNKLMAKREKAEPGPGRVGPIRPGHPPGHRQRPREPVDDLLAECHWLAMECQRQPP